MRFFDFDYPSANTFEFARQVAIKGARQDIILDIVVFVNGLPLAAIECKSPSLADPVGEATHAAIQQCSLEWICLATVCYHVRCLNPT